MDHYKGYRLGLYLVYGFLRRYATVGLLQLICERSHTSIKNSSGADWPGKGATLPP
ncbi:MAG: hypothetical protein WCA21_17375 [Terracidiphilus sp.]